MTGNQKHFPELFGKARVLAPRDFLTKALRAIPTIIDLDLPRAGIQMDWIVLGFSAALSIVTGILFGLAPSLGASRTDLMSTLRASGEVGQQQGIPRRILAAVNIRGLLVVAQIALSTVLLIGAVLLVESIAHLRHVNVGFNPANLLVMRITLPPLRYETDQKRAAFFERLVQGVEALPGVHNAVAAIYLPMMGFAGTPVQDADGPRLKLNERPIETIVTATPGYFRTIETPLKRGRDFSAQDIADSQRVATIDESLARQFWPGNYGTHVTPEKGEGPVRFRAGPPESSLGRAQRSPPVAAGCGFGGRIRSIVVTSGVTATVKKPNIISSQLCSPKCTSFEGSGLEGLFAELSK